MANETVHSSESPSSSTSSSSPKKQIVDKKNILVGCTGSVAAIKIPMLVNKLLDIGSFTVKVVATDSAKRFFSKEELSKIDLLTDENEWSTWKGRGDPVLHIELAKWADLFVIAPLDANTLGKMGLCDNLLTCVARAWDMKKPLMFCPAMNTKMYEHPITSTQIQTLVGWGYIEIPVVSKVLICGDKGLGAMAEVETIVGRLVEVARGGSQ